MRVFTIGDLHLPGPEGKHMDLFGEQWRDHPARIAADWDARVGDGDLVLVPGDITWAMRLEDAREDLAWLGARPGTIVLIRGNHDYWWDTITKVRTALPPRVHAIQNDVFVHGGVAVGGTRLWDVPDLSMGDIFTFAPGTVPRPPLDRERAGKIFERELLRLERSLAAMSDHVGPRVVLLHYPPTNPSLTPTRVTDLLSAYDVTLCLFGHVHAARPDIRFGGVLEGVRYELVSADFIDFTLRDVTDLL